MSKSQWAGRGFHRLAYFLAAIPLLVGSIGSVSMGFKEANYGSTQYHKLECAHDIYRSNEKRFWDLLSAYDPLSGEGGYLDVSAIKDGRAAVDLKALGCSNVNDATTFAQIKKLPQFSWLGTFASGMASWMPITLFLTLAVYGVVRGIGWVLDGFVAPR
jgi:hypothetical protein